MSHGTIASSYISGLPSLPWQSGASGDDVATGDFATWRGTTVDIAGNSAAGSIYYQQEAPGWVIGGGAIYENWAGDFDWAFGAIYKSEGETWAAAASGSYDTRWTTVITSLRNYWNNKTRGQMYIKFADDMNGDWTDWSVADGEEANFRTAWIRFRNIQQTVWPASKLVFSPHGNTVGFNYDWRTLWPGDSYVDVYATLWHSNHWTIQDSLPYDENGGPQSLALHQAFALTHGKPMAIHSWCLSSYYTSDNPDYIDYMYNFFANNYGTGAGQLLYETYLNQDWSNGWLYPENTTGRPLCAARYKALF